jgi:hypothetical protein
MEGINVDFFNQLHNLNSPKSSIIFETITDIPITTQDITSADITSADITSADITSADITSADITSADITTPDITTADITTADITTPDITTPDITQPIQNESRPKRVASARALENIRAVLEWEHCSKGSQLFKSVETHINSEFDSLNNKRSFANISKATVDGAVGGMNTVHEEDCMSEAYDTDHDQFNHDSTDDDDDYSIDSFVVSDSAKLEYDSTDDDDADLTDECSDDNVDEEFDEDLDSDTSTASWPRSDAISEHDDQEEKSSLSSQASTH